jgi:imidazoleglycerol-phosphate dehydratase/histidinol-phosphatase
MRALPETFSPYIWAPSTEELARRAGLDPFEIVRFDGNVPAQPHRSARPGTIAGTLAEVNAYAHGGHSTLVAAIADYAGVEPENVVLGAGADDLILLCARTFAGSGDEIAIAEEPTYPLYRVAVGLAGAEVGDADPAVTFCCRPNNPTGGLGELPQARPLVVDEAYFEYAGETAAFLIGEGVVVLRTFSKAFGLAGARVGYALADRDTAAELNRRQAPLPVSTLSAALALAALADPPEVGSELEERERLARGLRTFGLEPLPSAANFLFLPVPEPADLGEALLRSGVVVRVFAEGLRITVRDREDDDLLLEALARALERPAPVASAGARRVRHLHATAETRIRVRLALDGAGQVRVATGAGLYDHLLEQLAFHGGLDLVLEGVGDLETGPHHTAEDAALALGQGLDRALGDRRGIARYGDAVVPMDDALARAAVDLGGRPWAELRLEREPGLAGHVLQSLAQAGRLSLHVEATGRDEHHVAEAAFKATGRALRAAVRRGNVGVPSTKGLL